MQGKATFFGHPIHPVLVPFPVAFFSGALISDIVSHWGDATFWPRLSVVLIGFGIIGALAAAIFGFVDYMTAPLSHEARATATRHLMLMLVTVLIFIVAFFVRLGSATSSLGYVLTVVGVIVLGLGGNLGGHLAYHFRVGVDEGSDKTTAMAPPTRLVS